MKRILNKGMICLATAVAVCGTSGYASGKASKEPVGPITVASTIVDLEAKAVQEDGIRLIETYVLDEMKMIAGSEIIHLALTNQNEINGNLTKEQILEIDNEWRQEMRQSSKPVISASLTSPLSGYLTRIQAQSFGKYKEIFAVDMVGLNVGQSMITSDYWQGDEKKFSETFMKGPGAVYYSEAFFDPHLHNWFMQVSLTVSEGDTPIGAISFDVNLDEVERRSKISVEE